MPGTVEEKIPRDGVLRLTVLGCGGSMPIGRKDRILFGGATSCYMVQAGEDCVFLDAGTGILSAPASLPYPPLILLTHLHLDHVLGLGTYPRLLMNGEKTYLCLSAKNVKQAREKLDALFSPPFWPLSLMDYKGELELVPPSFPMRHGAMRIDCMEGRHPGGCLVFRISCGEKSIVYATDYEHDNGESAELESFARGTDLLLYDGQYRPEEYNDRKGFGHSTGQKGIELMERCCAKRLLLIHHDPGCTDADLLEREKRIGRQNVRFAREGEVIEL